MFKKKSILPCLESFPHFPIPSMSWRNNTALSLNNGKFLASGGGGGGGLDSGQALPVAPDQGAETTAAQAQVV